MRYLSLILCVCLFNTDVLAQGCRGGRGSGSYRGGGAYGYGNGRGAYGYGNPGIYSGGAYGARGSYPGVGAYGGNPYGIPNTYGGSAYGGVYGVQRTPGYTYNRSPGFTGNYYQYPGANQGFSYYQQNPQFLYQHQYYQQYNPQAGIGGYGGGYYGSPYTQGQPNGAYPFYGPYNQYYSPPVYGY